MKILFSNPPWWARGAADGLLRAGVRAGSRWPFTMHTGSTPDNPAPGEYLPFPMFLGFAASYAQEKIPGSIVILRDSIARRESYETFLAYLAAEKPDWIVVETATPSWEHDRTILNLACRAVPGMRVIVTGTITTTRFEEIHRSGFFTVAGEYEKGVVQLIGAAPINDYLKERGCPFVPYHVAHNFLTEDEMNRAPFPMFDEAVSLRYFDACPSGQAQPELTVWTTRGCTFRCSFCAWPAVMTNDDATGSGKRKVRFYSPEYLARWIEVRMMIEREKGKAIASIRLDDDTMNFGNAHTVGIAHALGALGLPWSAMCRADTISLETWEIMKREGCFGVKIGMESGSQRVVDKIIGKKLDLEDIETRILPAIRAAGLEVHTTWTVGLPGERPEEHSATIEMIRRLYAKGLHTTHQLSGTATIEGTPLDLMTRQGPLKAYPEAIPDQSFVKTGDGQAKAEYLAGRALPPPSSAGSGDS